MGRPRKPTKVLELTGAFKKNPKRRKERENEPEPDGPLGDAPHYFQLDQVARWNEIRSSCPWLTIADRPQVELAAKLWASEQRGENEKDDRRLYVQLFGRLGMDPSGRSKVQAPANPRKPANPFDQVGS